MRRAGLLYATAALALLSVPAAAQTRDDAVTPYPAAFFAPGQPYSAFDMIARLPGFSFDGGDSDVRGLSGAGGNVLIDGKRPSSKQGSLEDTLRRIPAGAVERIELIRAGAPGVDLQGRAVVANVVRKQAATTRGRVEIGADAYEDGRVTPRVSAEVSRKTGDRLWELSLAAGREVDDEKGEGPDRRFNPDGALEEDGRYREDQATDSLEAVAGHERTVGGGKLRADLSLRRDETAADILETQTFPDAETDVVAERETISQGEVGLRYDRALGDHWRSEFRLLHHQTRVHSDDTENHGEEISSLRSDSRESIVQGLARRDGGVLAFELGGEAAVNVLDSRTGLMEDGVAIDLPSANVWVEERRAEVFAALTWRASPSVTVELGSRFEVSELVQTGDSDLSKSFSYLKPRALLSWSPTARDIFRFEAVRLVGQLDFEDFVTSASLTSDTVTAGNPDLEPDRTWRVSAVWERRIGEDGSLVITVRHDSIEAVVDRIPVVGPGYAFDAPGNIGDGTRTEVELNARLPLDRLHVPGGLLKADVIWRDSEVTDPATGRTRRISNESAVEGSIAFTQDLPVWRARWGVEAVIGETEYEYRFDEIEREAIETRYEAFVEYRPTPVWNIRLKVENIAGGSVDRRRERHDGLRGTAPLDRIEVRSLEIGPSVGLTIQRTFGG